MTTQEAIKRLEGALESANKMGHCDFFNYKDRAAMRIVLDGLKKAQQELAVQSQRL